MPARTCGRFAPSATGPAHPGTLLAALLCWLDARSRGGRVVLRVEDLDRDRLRPGAAEALVEATTWLGLDWDAVVLQHERAQAHAQALDRLAERGLLYQSPTSRGDLEEGAYDNRDRALGLPPAGWRSCTLPLRARMPEDLLAPEDEGFEDLGGGGSCPDPVVRRRDAAVAYHLASVVDDADAGVDRVVRGRDLAACSLPQAGLRRLLGLPEPRYRHHFLLLETRERKLAKLHGAVGIAQLRPRYGQAQLVGLLAFWAGLRPDPGPCRPAELLEGFSWEQVRRSDLLVRWDGSVLTAVES